MHPSTLLLNQPLALSASRTAIMARLFRDGASAESFFGDKVNDDTPYEIHKGIAVIPVSGILLPGRGWSWSGATYYSAIRASLADALDNPDVSKIALLINSPGGTVSECADTADFIYAARGQKPIWAVLDDTAYSAAYALASSADFITVPRVGGVGSIGCVGMHVDITQALEKAGILVTTFQYGAQKTEGAPTTPLTDGSRKRMQAMIDEMGELFVSQVARNRDLDPGTVRDTQAGTFLGGRGIDLGLADEIATPEQAIAAFMKL